MLNRSTLLRLSIDTSVLPGYPQELSLEQGLIDTPGEEYGERAYAVYEDGEFRVHIRTNSVSSAVLMALESFEEILSEEFTEGGEPDERTDKTMTGERR